MNRSVGRCIGSIGFLLALAHAAVVVQSGATEPPAEAAAGSEAADDTEQRDAEALAALKRATDFLTSLPRFHLEAVATYDVIQEDGRRLQFEKRGEIYVQRPNRLFAEVRLDDGRHRQLWYDGTKLSLAERSRKLHTQIKAPPTVDAMLDMLEELFDDPMPLADLLYSDLTPLGDLALVADVVGESRVGDRVCEHLSFRGETVDWQIWVDEGDLPYIRKLAITYREQPGTPQFVAILDDWEAPDRFDDDLFIAAFAADSQWVNVLVPMSRRAAGGRQP